MLLPNAELLAHAALGDGFAQAEAARAYLADTELRPLDALAGAELMARLAICHAVPDSARLLATVLMTRAGFEREHGDVSRAAGLDAEAMTLLEQAADAGDELAAQAIVTMGDLLPAASFRLLREMKAVETGA